MYKENLIESHQRIKPYIHNTPVLSSQLLNKIAGSQLFFKCENFQKMGAFKMRGATNAIMQLTDEQKQETHLNSLVMPPLLTATIMTPT